MDATTTLDGPAAGLAAHAPPAQRDGAVETQEAPDAPVPPDGFQTWRDYVHQPFPDDGTVNDDAAGVPTLTEAGVLTLIDRLRASTWLNPDPDAARRRVERSIPVMSALAAASVSPDWWPPVAERIKRASAALKLKPGAKSGQNGHGVTFEVACYLVCDFAVPADEALRMLVEEYNPRCDGPWELHELEHKVRDALTKPITGAAYSKDAAKAAKPAKRPAGRPPTPPAAAAPPAPGNPGDTRPRILYGDINGPLPMAIVEQGVKLMAAKFDNDLFTKDGILVLAERTVSGSLSLGFIVADRDALASRMAESAKWCRLEKNGTETYTTIPPPWVTGEVLSGNLASGWVRSVKGVTSHPVFLANGSILQTEGYDEASGILYRPLQKYNTIPDDVTPDMAKAAAARLLGIVCDVMFEKDAHRSAWMSLVLTLVARFAIDGSVPLFAFDANQRGAGKGLAYDAACLAATGRAAGRMSLPVNLDEQEKTLVAMAIRNPPTVLIDNVRTELGGVALEKILTARVVDGRILGASDFRSLAVNTVIAAAGNNIRMTDDMERRTIRMRIVFPDERPENRRGFRNPNLEDHVGKNHITYCSDAITILRGYHLSREAARAAGREPPEIAAFGSFQPWSDLIRQAVIWCGLPDPYCPDDESRALTADPAAEPWADLLHAMCYTFNMRGPKNAKRAADFLRAVQQQCHMEFPGDAATTARDSILGIIPGAKTLDSVTTKALSGAFVRHRDIPRGGLTLKSVTDKNTNSNVWYVAESPTTAGTAATARRATRDDEIPD